MVGLLGVVPLLGTTVAIAGQNSSDTMNEKDK